MHVMLSANVSAHVNACTLTSFRFRLSQQSFAPEKTSFRTPTSFVDTNISEVGGPSCVHSPADVML